MTVSTRPLRRGSVMARHYNAAQAVADQMYNTLSRGKTLLQDIPRGEA